MSKIILSVCSRTDKRGSCLAELQNMSIPGVMQTRISWNAKSWYEGHKLNALQLEEDDDIIVLAHDDLEIMSHHGILHKYLEICKKPSTGFIGLAGCTHLGYDGIWWNARSIGASRGFVFQGKDSATMTPNYFGQHGQVVALDGCFLACSYRTLKKVGLDQPEYLKSGWDFYDVDLTLRAHLMGLNNYTVPIICRHESDGQMRKEWYDARQAFLKHHNQNVPCKLNHDKTGGLPV